MYDYRNMNMSRDEYVKHCTLQKAKTKEKNMCDVLRRIQNKSAQDLLDMIGQSVSVPVDLKALLGKINMSCKPYDFSAIESSLNLIAESDACQILGALATKGNRAVILYKKNDDINDFEYRVTVAHELGHSCLGHYNISDATVNYRHEGEVCDEKEQAANVFACELLIPEKELMDIIDRLILPSVSALARIFAVPEYIMYARLKYLNVRNSIIGYNY